MGIQALEDFLKADAQPTRKGLAGLEEFLNQSTPTPRPPDQSTAADVAQREGMVTPENFPEGSQQTLSGRDLSNLPWAVAKAIEEQFVTPLRQAGILQPTEEQAAAQELRPKPILPGSEEWFRTMEPAAGVLAMGGMRPHGVIGSAAREASREASRAAAEAFRNPAPWATPEGTTLLDRVQNLTRAFDEAPPVYRNEARQQLQLLLRQHGIGPEDLPGEYGAEAMRVLGRMLPEPRPIEPAAGAVPEVVREATGAPVTPTPPESVPTPTLTASVTQRLAQMATEYQTVRDLVARGQFVPPNLWDSARRLSQQGEIQMVGRGVYRTVTNPRTTEISTEVPAQTPAPVVPAAPAKESWEMTDAEIRAFVGSGSRLQPNSFLDFPKSGQEIIADYDKYGTVGAERKWAIESAVRSGKPVPPEVLAKYPDLKPQAVSPSAPVSPSIETSASPAPDLGIPEKPQIGFGEKGPVLGEFENDVLDKMIDRATMASEEPLSGKNVARPGYYEENIDMAGPARVGFASMRPEWMQNPTKGGKPFDYDETIAVLQALKRGEWPTGTNKAQLEKRKRIAYAIIEALRSDAEFEKSWVASERRQALTPEATAPITETDAERAIREAFEAEVDRLAAEEQSVGSPMSVEEIRKRYQAQGDLFRQGEMIGKAVRNEKVGTTVPQRDVNEGLFAPKPEENKQVELPQGVTRIGPSKPTRLPFQEEMDAAIADLQKRGYDAWEDNGSWVLQKDGEDIDDLEDIPGDVLESFNRIQEIFDEQQAALKAIDINVKRRELPQGAAPTQIPPARESAYDRGLREKTEQYGQPFRNALLKEAKLRGWTPEGVPQSLDSVREQERFDSMFGDAAQKAGYRKTDRRFISVRDFAEKALGVRNFDDMLLEIRGIISVQGPREAGPGAKAVPSVGAVPVASPIHEHKYGNTQVNLPPQSADAVRALAAKIPDSDLMAGGREADAHITVRYGLKGEGTAAVTKALQSVQPFTVTLGTTKTFPPSKSSDNAGVVYVDATAPELDKLNGALTKTGAFAESTHAGYKPHVTLAYVKPESAKKYAGMTDLQGHQFTVDRITVSTPTGKEYVVPLLGGGTQTGAKQPWEMTREEFADTYNQWANSHFAGQMVPDNLRPLSVEYGRLQSGAPPGRADAYGIAHRGVVRVNPELLRERVVMTAAREGKPVPPSVLADYPDLQAASPVASPMRVETAQGTKAVAKMDPRLIQVLGGNLYEGDLGMIAVKEMLQNAVDSVRALPDPSKGGVSVNIDSKKNYIEVTDNGPGMTPEVATREFVDIGGSKKVEGSSGGFGIAKVAIFSHAAEIYAHTTALDPATGKTVSTTIHGSAEEWADPDKGLSVTTKEVHPGTQTGTIVRVTLKPGVSAAGYNAQMFLGQLLSTHRLPFQISVKLDGRMPIPETVDNTPVHFVSTVQAKGAQMDFYASKETQRKASIDYQVLNNGLPQFRDASWLGGDLPLPKKIVVDIKSTAGPDTPDYPFRPDRQGLRGPTAVSLSNYVTTKFGMDAANLDKATYAKAFKDALTIKGTDIALVDTTGAIDASLLKSIAKAPYLAILAENLRRAFHLIQAQAGLETTAKFAGIGLGDRYLAINVKGDAVMGPGNPNLILLNPYNILLELEAAVKAGVIKRAEAYEAFGDWIVSAITHELAHQVSRGHTEEFAGALTRLQVKIARLGVKLADQFAETMGPKGLFGRSTDAYDAIYNHLQQLEKQWTGKANILGSISSGLTEPAGPSGPPGGPVAGPPGGPRSAVPVSGRGPNPAEDLAAGTALLRRQPGQGGSQPTVGRRAIPLPPSSSVPEPIRQAMGMPATPAPPQAPVQPDPTQPNFKPPTTDAEIQDIVTRRDIVKLLEQATVPIRKGQVPKVVRNAMGAFKPWPEVIRLRYLTAVETAAHEIGHYIQKKFLGQFSLTPEDVAGLERLGRALYKGKKPPPVGFLGEGLAEFTRLYMEDPAAAEGAVQGFTQKFETVLGQNAPEIQTSLQGARERLANWKQYPPVLKIDSRIDYSDMPSRQWTLQRALNRMRYLWADRDDPLRIFEQFVLQGKPLAPKDSAYLAARIFRHIEPVKQSIWEYGPVRFKDVATYPADKRVALGMRDILPPVWKNVRLWQDYLLAWRLRDVFERPTLMEQALKDLEAGGAEAEEVEEFKTAMEEAVAAAKREALGGVTLQDVTQAIAELDRDHPEFAVAAQKLYAHRSAVLQMLVDGGVITQKSKDLMESAWPHHVPLIRRREAEGRPVYLYGRRLAQSPEKIAQYRGSAEQILPPLQSIYMKEGRRIEDVYRNDVMRRLYNLSQTVEAAGKWIEEVEKPRRDTVTAWVDGKPHYLVLDPDTQAAVSTLASMPGNVITAFFASMTAILKTGVTSAPEFIIGAGGNLFRDQQTAFMQAVLGYSPTDTINAFAKILKHDPRYQAYMVAGGAWGGVQGAYNPKAIKRAIERAAKGGTYVGSMANEIRHPLDAVALIGHIFEEATRYGQTMAMEKKLLTGGIDPQSASEMSAVQGGAEVTLDFLKQGYLSAWINLVIPFFSANVNGLDKFISTVHNQPYRTALRGSILTLASLLLALYNGDDPRIRQRPGYERARYWMFSLHPVTQQQWLGMSDAERAAYEAKYPIFRVMKDFAWGAVFATAPEMFYEYFFQHHPEAFQRAGEAISQGFLLPYSLSAITPFAENFVNKAMGTGGRPVVPQSMSRLEEPEQYYAYTPETYKRVAQGVAKVTPEPVRTAIGLTPVAGPVLQEGVRQASSPLMLQHLIEGTFGTLPRYPVAVSDWVMRQTGLSNRPEIAKHWADYPFIGRFVSRSSSAQAQAKQQVYDEFQRLDKIQETLKTLRQRPNGQEAAAAYQKAHQADLTKMGTLRATVEAFAQGRRIQAKIMAAPNITPEERQRQVDTIEQGMIRRAEATLRAIGAWERQPIPGPVREAIGGGNPLDRIGPAQP